MSRYIVTSDLHLRPDRPLCRLDPDWMETQRNMLRNLVHLTNTYHADLLICGDIFDSPNVPSSVLSMFIEEMCEIDGVVKLIAGNHSLKWHKQENLMESSIGVIATLANIVDNPILYLQCEDKTTEGIFEHSALISTSPFIYMVHTLTFKDEVPFGARAYTAQELCDKYPDAKYIFTGDNHTSFHVEHNGVHIINPGAPIIQSASDLDYEPVCYFVDTEEEEIECIELYSDRTMLTDNHLLAKHERDDRISSFVETVKKNGKVSLSFLDNLQNAMQVQDLSEDIKNMIEEIQMEISNV